MIEGDGTREGCADEEIGTDALTVISETGLWIRSADTKTGFGLTGLTVLLAAQASQAKTIQVLWKDTSAATLADWFLAISVLLLTAAYLLFVGVLTPRTQTTAPNRFSWPWVARATEDDLEGLSGVAVRREAWLQARTLALIAATKFRLLKWGIRSTAVSALFYLLAMLIR